MNPSAPHPHRRRLTRAEVRRRRRSRAIRRVAGLTVMLCVAAGGVSFLLTRRAVVPSASAASAISMPAQSIADPTVSSAENTAAPANALGLTADEADFEARRCLSCGNCFECDGCLGACPEDAVIKLGKGHRYRFDYEKCTGCATCYDQCPAHAIEMIAEK